jgi:parvulin-like peptidyl-prolyl isomerase
MNKEHYVIKRLLAGCLALLMLASCASTAADVPALQPTPDTSDAVARISYPSGAVELVTRAEFEQARDKLLQGAPEEYVLDYVTSRHLLLEQGRTQNIVADPKEVDDFVENIRSQTCTQIPLQDPAAQNDPAQLLEACANFFGFQGAAGMRRYLQEEIIVNQVIEAAAKGEDVHAAHILVNTEEEAKQVRERVTTGGEDFATVAKEVSIEPAAKESGGDLGFFGPGQMVPEFEQAAFALADGEISQPVQTQFGWHIIKTIERRPSETVSPEAANAYREQVLAQAEQDGRIEFLITPAPPPTPAALPTVDIGPIESAIPEDATALPPIDATTVAPGETVLPDVTVVPEATSPPVAPAETTTATP